MVHLLFKWAGDGYIDSAINGGKTDIGSVHGPCHFLSGDLLIAREVLVLLPEGGESLLR